MRLEGVPEEEAPLEEAQKEVVPEEDLDESAVDGCAVSEQKEYNLVGNKERDDVADGSVGAFSLEESGLCWQLLRLWRLQAEDFRRYRT